jgi:hypothetical protein
MECAARLAPRSAAGARAEQTPDALPPARRGVVRLYNAVAKAQRAQREAAAGGARGRAARLSKAGLLAELRGAAPAPAPAVRAAWAPACPLLPWQQGGQACVMRRCSRHAERGMAGCGRSWSFSQITCPAGRNAQAW